MQMRLITLHKLHTKKQHVLFGRCPAAHYWNNMLCFSPRGISVYLLMYVPVGSCLKRHCIHLLHCCSGLFQMSRETKYPRGTDHEWKVGFQGEKQLNKYTVASRVGVLKEMALAKLLTFRENATVISLRLDFPVPCARFSFSHEWAAAQGYFIIRGGEEGGAGGAPIWPQICLSNKTWLRKSFHGANGGKKCLHIAGQLFRFS